MKEPGGAVTFTVRVTNTNVKTLTLFSLVDDVHGDLNGQGTCSVPQTIAAGNSYECAFSADISGNAGYTEIDTITGRATDEDNNVVEDSDSATVTITGEPASEAWLVVIKFHDLNGNGTRDANEPYLSGWTFRVTADGQISEIVTNERGTATQDGLREGQTVTVEERLDLLPDEGWLSTTGNPVQITLQRGENVVEFGNVQGKPPKTGRGGLGFAPGAQLLWPWAAMGATVVGVLTLLTAAERRGILSAVLSARWRHRRRRPTWLALLFAMITRRRM